jgi:integrase
VKLKFRDLSVRSQLPRADRYDVRDELNPGFALRVFPNGSKSWVFIYHYQGRKRRMTLGRYPSLSLKDAHKAYRAAKKRLDDGVDPASESQVAKANECRAPTVGALVDDYLERWAKPNKRSWREDERILNKDVLPEWKWRKAKDITRRDITGLLDSVIDRGAGIQANRTLAVVRKMFNFGVQRGLLDHTPCLGVAAPAQENRRDRVLSKAEIRTFWHALDGARMAEGTRLALKLQLLTAQRIGETVRAAWDEFDLLGGAWTIPAKKAKNKCSHFVPLCSQAIAIVERARCLVVNSRWVFPSPRGDQPINETAIGHAVRRNLDTFGVGQFTPHDLRRTAASQMTAMGISRLVVSKILNHVERGVIAVYDRHSYDLEKRQALEAWGRMLQTIVTADSSHSNVVSLKTAS